jgi:hypothetical protein
LEVHVEIFAKVFEMLNGDSTCDELSAAFYCKDNCNMEWVVQHHPDLLANAAKTVVLDLIKIQHLQNVLNK